MSLTECIDALVTYRWKQEQNEGEAVELHVSSGLKGATPAGVFIFLVFL